MLVFDATPLIYLTKTGCLKYLEKLEDEKVIPRSVYHEGVEKGKKKGHQDSLKFEKAVEEDVFRIIDVEKGKMHEILDNDILLSDADKDVLQSASDKGAIALMDESYGRDIADIEDIKNRGSIYLIFRFLKKDLISEEKAKDIVDSMIDEGWYCSTDLYKHIYRKIEEYQS